MKMKMKTFLLALSTVLVLWANNVVMVAFNPFETSAQETKLTHTTLREWASEIENIRKVIDERDRRYEDRFKAQESAVAAALAAQEKMALQIAMSSEKAILKAEDAQRGVNERGNEFRKSLDDYTKLMIPRAEADIRFAALEKEVVSLREFRSEGSGRQALALEGRDQTNWITGQWIAAVFSALALVISIIAGMKGSWGRKG